MADKSEAFLPVSKQRVNHESDSLTPKEHIKHPKKYKTKEYFNVSSSDISTLSKNTDDITAHVKEKAVDNKNNTDTIPTQIPTQIKEKAVDNKNNTDTNTDTEGWRFSNSHIRDGTSETRNI